MDEELVTVGKDRPEIHVILDRRDPEAGGTEASDRNRPERSTEPWP